MADIRFDGKVAIVTGAGGGLGRQHALELARRGAKVVVNDLGASLDGSGGSSAAADQVVAEIKAAGGEAIADGGSVSDDAGAVKRGPGYNFLNPYGAERGYLNRSELDWPTIDGRPAPTRRSPRKPRPMPRG